MIELVITDETPEPLPALALTNEEILDCFLGTELNGSYRQYLLNAGRAVEDKLRVKLLPIDMVLHCPKCRHQHVDAPDPAPQFASPDGVWTNPPHRSHLCHACGHVWRPADIPTNGVEAVKTRGGADA